MRIKSSTIYLFMLVLSTFSCNKSDKLLSIEKYTEIDFKTTFQINIEDEDWVFVAPDVARMSLKFDYPLVFSSSCNLVCQLTAMDKEETIVYESKIHETAGTISKDISFASPAPGFYYCSLYFRSNGEKTKDTTFVIGFDPERIKIATSAKPDFKDFWDKNIAELKTVEPDYKITSLPQHSTSLIDVYYVEMKSYGEEIISGFYSRPKKEGVYPGILRCLGYGKYDTPPIMDNAHGDFCTFTVVIRGGSDNQYVNDYGSDHILYGLSSKEDYFYRGAFMDIIRGIDFLDSREEVDSEKIVSEGGSQGAALAIVASALDKRIKATAAWMVFLCDYPNLIEITSWPGNLYKEYIEQHSDEDVYDVLSYFDIKNFAPYITQPVHLSFGLQDPITPPLVNISFYNNLKITSKQCLIQPQREHNAGLNYIERAEYFRSILNK